MLLGIAACIVASFGLGSVFVPIKKFAPSDGFMVQFFISLAAFLVSLAVHAFLGFPPIYGLAMLGGSLWCMANSFAIVIMNRLGMALGILIWSSVSCITGWATSRYGLFGVPKGVPNSEILNYIGVIILVIGSSFYLFIKSHIHHHHGENSEKVVPEKFEPRDVSIEKAANQASDAASVDENKPHHHVPLVERLICLAGAVFSGLFYGSMCTPVTFIQHRPDLYPDAPLAGLPYLFSFYCGVLPTSTVILIIYSIVKKNNPVLPPNLVLPSMLGGALFAIGMGGFFIGNERLSQTIAYPICSFAPGLVVSAWSVFYIKEIKGKKNFILLGISYAFTFIGVILVTVSKDI